MAEHPNATLIRQYLDRQDDPDALSEMLTDDIEWHEIGRSEAIHGKAALRERYLGGGAPEWKITGGEIHDVIGGDDHTVALLSAVPIAHPRQRRQRRRITLEGDVPSAANPPSGCHFRTRCWKADETCAAVVPPLDIVDAQHRVACHHPEVVQIAEPVRRLG